jgi:hypothetical protein
VGATRTSSWFGSDPIYCNQIPGTSMGIYTTVRAGRLAANPWTSRQQLCPPPEAGAPEGGNVDDATVPPPDSTDADLTDTAPPVEASADAPDDAEASQ